ncbi:hypothetical protein CIPAW_03G268200 [Carya illinoinensis]|uniref:Uncharacterized protein n=1 Tax=Carya illinoinensis TaxID=32201 RepID=A0A8T1R9P7_CARIL|nr:hypothetical protein CIPAW_03G268200 [Carya illinoinensis]
MRSKNRIGKRRGRELRRKLGKIVKCMCSGEQFSAVDEMAPSSESLAIKNYSETADSLKAVEVEKKLDTGNIEEAESSLRESGCLNYEEARALLGRYEYQKGNIEAALHVFEGIDIAVVTPKIKVALARKGEHHKRRSQNFANPSMSIHAVSLLLEAIFLKAKSLQGLGRFKEAAQSCKVILDIVESSLPGGLPENFGADCKLQETLNKAVELLPELWKLADSPHEAILSYRQALLHHWNLDAVTTAKIQKEFAIFLLYSGGEASPPNLRSQMDSLFIPRNNIEEAILLLMILLRKVSLKRIEWDPSILDHLSFALSVAGDLRALANQVEELPPGIINRKDRAFESLDGGCNQLESIANFLLGVSLSAHSKSAVADSDRATRQSKTVQALETAGKMTRMSDPNILYHLSLENADQRKLDAALYYAKRLLKLEGGYNVHGWLLLARILSAKKQFIEAETVINAALDETGKWDQGELLRTKAKLQIAQGQLKIAIDTYTQLLAILQVQRKSFGSGKKLVKSSKTPAKSLEVEVWHDLAYLYISLSQWRDAEICLSKSKAICSYSASRCHATGVLYEAKGLYKEALKAFADALEIDPTHVPSLISTAVVFRQLGNPSHAVVKSFLMNALQLDRMNHSAWYNLGLLYKAEGTASSLLEATEYFEAATLLEESAPIEPFR